MVLRVMHPKLLLIGRYYPFDRKVIFLIASDRGGEGVHFRSEFTAPRPDRLVLARARRVWRNTSRTVPSVDPRVDIDPERQAIIDAVEED